MSSKIWRYTVPVVVAGAVGGGAWFLRPAAKPPAEVDEIAAVIARDEAEKQAAAKSEVAKKEEEARKRESRPSPQSSQ